MFTCSTMFSANHIDDVPVYSYVFNHHVKKGLPTNDLCYEPNCKFNIISLLRIHACMSLSH